MANHLHPSNQDREVGLSAWMRAVEGDVHKARTHASEKVVHRLRTNLRRCRAIANGFQTLDPSPLWPALRRAAKRLFGPLGDLRDVQVRQMWVERLASPDEPAARRYQELLGGRLSELERLAGRAVRAFDRKRWRAWERSLPGACQRLPLGHPLLELLAAHRCQAAYDLHRRAMRTRSRIAWHELRIALKRFRYTVENFLPQQHAAWGEEQKALQDLLGEVHDLDLLWEEMSHDRTHWSPTELADWKQRVAREVDARTTAYRAQAAGLASPWTRWRAALAGVEERFAAPAERLRAWCDLWDGDLRHKEVQVACQLLEDLRDRGVLAPASSLETRHVLRFAAAALALDDVLDTGGDRAFYRWLRDLSVPLGLGSSAMLLVAAIVRSVGGSRPGYLRNDLASLPEEDRRWIEQLAGILRLSHRLETGLNGALRGIVVESSPDDSLVLAARLDDPSVPFGPKLRREKDLLSSACGRPIVLYPYVTTRTR